MKVDIITFSAPARLPFGWLVGTGIWILQTSVLNMSNSFTMALNLTILLVSLKSPALL
jgi:hypothetical protein